MRRTLLIAAGLLLAAGQAAAQPRGSWQEGCRHAELRGGTLSAECLDRNGRWHRSSIRFTDCPGQRVANRDGRLVCEAGGGGGAAQRVPGDWDNSCRDAELRGNVLTATCRERDGGWRRSSIRFTDCPRNMVANQDGRLVCSIGGGGGGGGGAAQRVPGDWDESCREAELRGNVLFATCRTTGGDWRRSSIRFTDCPGNRVRNENGWLVCAQWGGWGESDWRRVPGSWDESCRDASLRGGVLTATCRTTSGRWERSSIAFRDCPGERVRNDDGRLVCEGHGGPGGLLPGLPGLPGLR
jgi:hypothetical protein